MHVGISWPLRGLQVQRQHPLRRSRKAAITRTPAPSTLIAVAASLTPGESAREAISDRTISPKGAVTAPAPELAPGAVNRSSRRRVTIAVHEPEVGRNRREEQV